MLIQLQYDLFYARLGQMNILKIFATFFFLPGLLFAQEANTSPKKYEVGLNGAVLVGGLMGSASERLTQAVFVKYRLPNLWLRGSFQQYAPVAGGWVDQNLLGTELVQVNSITRRNGSFGTLGLEWRKVLRKQVEFTYGADLVYGRSAEMRVQSETRSSDFSVKQIVNGQPLYDARFGPVAEMLRDERTADQVGARLSAGLKIDLHTRWFVHFQSSVGALLHSGQRDYVNRYTNERLTYGYTTFIWQKLPVLNEMALYFRF